MSDPELSQRLLRVAMLGHVPTDDPHVIADAQAEVERLRALLVRYQVANYAPEDSDLYAETRRALEGE